MARNIKDKEYVMGRYQRRPLIVEAYRVSTQDSAEDIAEWCGGRAHWVTINSTSFAIPAVTLRATDFHPPAGRAIAGQWVVHEGDDFSVYTDSDFENEFEPCQEDGS